MLNRYGIQCAGISHLVAPYTIGRVHPDFHVVLFCEGGAATFRTPDETWTTAPGETVVLPAGRPHLYKASAAWNIVWFHLRPDHRAWSGLGDAAPARRPLHDIGALRAALGLPFKKREQVIQDVEIPYENASAFLDFYFREIDIRPCWICPLRPLEAAGRWTLYAMEPRALYLNFGFWGSVPTTPDQAPGHFNRRIEAVVHALGGRKSL